MTVEAEEYFEILPSVTIPCAEGLWRLLHLCELLGFSTWPQNMHRNRKAPSPYHRDQTVVFTVLVQCSRNGPYKMITAFEITCSENWNKWEQSVGLPHTHCHRPVVHKRLPIFFCLLCMEVLLHCMELWVGFQIWPWKASKEMAFTWDWAFLYDRDSTQVCFTEAMKLWSDRKKLLDTGLSQKLYLDWGNVFLQWIRCL